MKSTAYHILRIGMGITFIWLGISIWMAPEAWGSLIQPWAEALLPLSVEQTMQGAAIFDIIVGAWLIIGFLVWIPALLGALHIVGVLVATSSGFGNVIIRDIGLLAASTALFLESRSR